MQQTSPGNLLDAPGYRQISEEVLLTAAKGLHGVEDCRISGFPKHVSSPQVWALIGDRGAGGILRPCSQPGAGSILASSP